MATWTRKKTNLKIDSVYAATDGTDIYWIDGLTDIYKYDVGADSVSQIASSASFDGNSELQSMSVNLCWFKSNLYVAVRENPGDSWAQVWKYVSGTTWTKVFTDNGVDNDNVPILLMSDDNYLVLVSQSNVSGTSRSFHSTDGGSFSAGTISGITTPNFGNYVTIKQGNDTTLGIIGNCKDDTGPTYNIVKFNAGTWSIVEVLSGNNEWHHLSAPDYFWKRNTSGNYIYTTDFASYTEPSLSSRIPIRELALPYSVAANLSGGDVQVRFWDTDTLQWGDAESFTPLNSPNLVCHIIRVDNNAVFALVGAGAGNNNAEIWQRDTDIPLPATNAIFYEGAGTLAQKFTLPFSGVNPKAMTLNAPLGTVVIGGDTPAGVVMVYSTYPYATGVATQDGLPTGVSFTNVNWV